MTEATTRARGAGTRWLTVVVGPRRYDVVVDEHLLVAEVLALVSPQQELMAVTMSGESVPLDETVELAHLETGTMLLTAPLDAHVPAPRLRRNGPDPARPGGLVGDGLTAGSRQPMTRASTPGGSSSRRRLGYATGATGEPEEKTEIGSGRPQSAGGHPRPGPAGTPVAAVRPTAMVLVAAALAGLAVAAGLRARPTWGPQLAAVLLVAFGVLLVQNRRAPRIMRLTAPLLGLAGGAVLAASLAAGSLVVVVGACAAAALVALTGRMGTGAERYVPRVWLGFGAGVGGAALVALVLGMSLTVVAALAMAAVALLARIVPDLVLDVDDDVLLDINRLSVTSWSPREARRPRRRGWRIDDRAVGSIVAAASVEQVAAIAGLLVLSTGASAVLLQASLAADSAVPLSVRLLLVSATVAVTLTARAYRRRRDRMLLRLAAVPPFVAVALPAVLGLTSGWVLLVTGATVVVAFALLGLAVAVGRGYRSLWASRLADLGELLALASVLPLALWAGGLVERAMGLFA